MTAKVIKCLAYPIEYNINVTLKIITQLTFLLSVPDIASDFLFYLMILKTITFHKTVCLITQKVSAFSTDFICMRFYHFFGRFTNLYYFQILPPGKSILFCINVAISISHSALNIMLLLGKKASQVS